MCRKAISKSAVRNSKVIVGVLMVCVVAGGCKDARDVGMIGDGAPTTTIETEGVIDTVNEFAISFAYPEGMWNNLDLTYSTYKNQGEFEEQALSHISTIEKTLGIANWYEKYGTNLTGCKMTFKIVDTASEGIGGNAQWPTTDGGHGICSTIKLDKMMVRCGIDGLPHELTHVLCGNSFSRSLDEGLADYMCRVCVGQTPVTGQVSDVNDWLKGYYEKMMAEKMTGDKFAEYEQLEQESMNMVGNKGKEYPYGTGSKSQLWFAYSESFVEYLIETYGPDKVMNLYLYGTDNEDYKKLDSKGYDGILTDWKEYYNNYQVVTSYEDMQNVNQERISRVQGN